MGVQPGLLDLVLTQGADLRITFTRKRRSSPTATALVPVDMTADGWRARAQVVAGNAPILTLDSDPDAEGTEGLITLGADGSIDLYAPAAAIDRAGAADWALEVTEPGGARYTLLQGRATITRRVLTS